MVATAYGERPTDLQLDQVCVSVAAQIEARDWVYEVRSEYCSSDWFLADRRCFRLIRYYMGRWIRRRMLQTVNTLLYDPILAEGREANYAAGHRARSRLPGL